MPSPPLNGKVDFKISRMKKAYWFHDIRELTDFLLLHGNDSKSKAGFDLLRVRDHHKQEGFLLFNLRRRTSLWSKLTAEHQPQQVTAEWTKNVATVKPGRWEMPSQFTVVESRNAGRLLELIDLQHHEQRLSEQPYLVFWFEQVADADQFVADSLRLSNDHIQVAQLSGKSQPIVLRVDSPSFFLLQRCLEEQHGSVRVFYPVTDKLFVEWGWRHQWEKLWLQESNEELASCLFFRSDSRHSAPEITWTSLYDVAEWDLTFDKTTVWTQQSLDDVRFHIPVALQRQQSNVRDPQFWLMEASEQPYLEQLIQVLDRNELDGVLLSVIETETQRHFVAQQKGGTNKKRFLDFRGIALAPYEGIQNLLLPIGYRLSPALRRDQYQKLFELPRDQITMLIPQSATSENPERISPTNESEFESADLMRVPLSSFKPLKSLIDYVAQTAEVQLKAIQVKSVFDFAHYGKAPKRPDLTPRKEHNEPTHPSRPARLPRHRKKMPRSKGKRVSLD